ncbi:MAG: glutathionylspermidine synthase family protein [Deltaproteobacteria bacterium]|nr:glutathionylspermidine synthase family protein [Deltaproteobacteria bacterium]
MESPWHSTDSLPPDVLRKIRLKTIFDCCKWDPQIGDFPALAAFPIILDARQWRTIAAAAEAMSVEILQAETEVLRSPGLHGGLGLPGAMLREFRRVPESFDPPRAVRVMRFDFHYTTEGWRVSEVNTDVPGGFVEGSGFSRQVAGCFPTCGLPGDPAGSYMGALVSRCAPDAAVAFVYATGYADDRQVVQYLANQARRLGAAPIFGSPTQLVWTSGRAAIQNDGEMRPVDAIVRFFPAEWLPNLPRSCVWANLVGGSRTPISNPVSAILTQSKRFPLIWDELATRMKNCRTWIPETRKPGDEPCGGGDEWVLKPAFGRVGDGVLIQDVTSPREAENIGRQMHRHPERWVRQRRFVPVPLEHQEDLFYPCIGVFTVDGRAAGAYGRVARRPLVDQYAQDAAVLIRDGHVC